MKFKSLFLLAIVHIIFGNGQILELPDVDHFASQFVVRIHHIERVRGSHLSNGIFFNSRTIVTTASSVHNINATLLRAEFFNTNLVGNQTANIDTVIIHPDFNANNLLENNLAILRLTEAEGTRIAPMIQTRHIGRLVRGNHFCSMFGYGEIFSDRWQGLEPMHMVPVRIETNTTHCNFLFRGDFTCTFGPPRVFELCGGFMGSPIVCDGNQISGMVTRDHYCGERPTAYIMELDRHVHWIQRVSGSANIMGSLLIVFAAFLMSKVL